MATSPNKSNQLLYALAPLSVIPRQANVTYTHWSNIMNSRDRGILRPHQATISVLQKLFDLCVICIGMNIVIAVNKAAWDYSTVIATLFALVIFYLLSDFGQLYVSWRGERTREELRKVGGIWAISFTGVAVTDYLSPEITVLSGTG